MFTASALKLGALSSSKPGTVVDLAGRREGRADEGPRTGVVLTPRRP